MSNDTDKLAEAVKQQIEKFRQTFKLPDMDTSALVDNQRKTIDAMSKAAQLSNQTATEISQRQLEILRTTSEHVATMMQDAKLSTVQQRDLAAKAFEAALTSTRELAEMTVKSNTEVFDLVKQRLAENFEEMRKSWKS